MVLLLLSLMAHAADPASTPSSVTAAEDRSRPTFGLGVTYDLGIVPSGLTIGWAGAPYVGVTSVLGFSCVGGKAMFSPADSPAMVGVEGTWCGALTWTVDAESSSVGGYVGVRSPAGAGRYGTVQFGMGYSGGRVDEGDVSWEGMYIRPRATVMVERGLLAFEVGPFIQLPILFTQRVEGELRGPGMLTRIGIELSVMLGRFDD